MERGKYEKERGREENGKGGRKRQMRDGVVILCEILRETRCSGKK